MTRALSPGSSPDSSARARQAAPSRLGLYVHVPFCATKCGYCDFPSFSGRMADRTSYVTLLLDEMAQRAWEAAGQEVDSLYIGGGTPSLLTPAHITDILQQARRLFRLSANAEISCEVNPGATSVDFLKALAAGGVNRLSIGAQSADDEVLRVMGRKHSWQQVASLVALARNEGIHNINIDLMVGVPTQSEQNVAHSLQAALELAPTHLSVYELILEEGTAFSEQVESATMQLPDEELTGRIWDLVIQRLLDAGYRRYEVSNFAMPGFESRHNLGTWDRLPYLGFGAAAHSLVRSHLRRQNPASLDDYLAQRTPQFFEVTRQEAAFESLMLGLRTVRGVDMRLFKQQHQGDIDSFFGRQITDWEKRGLAQRDDSAGFLALTARGLDLLNSLLIELL